MFRHMKLRDWRKSKNLTMAEAVEILGLSQPSISRIERGEQWPDRETAQQIMARTDGAVTPNDLIIDAPPETEGAAA